MRKKSAYTAAAFAFMVILSAGVTAIKLVDQESENFAIITAGEARLFEAPMDEGEPDGVMKEGTKVKILDREANWLKISSPSGLVRWVDRSDTGII